MIFGHTLNVLGLKAITVLPIGDWWNWWSQPKSFVAAFVADDSAMIIGNLYSSSIVSNGLIMMITMIIYSSSMVSKGLLFFPLLLLSSSSLPMLDTGDFISDLRIWGLITFVLLDKLHNAYILFSFFLWVVEAWTYLKKSLDIYVWSYFYLSSKNPEEDFSFVSLKLLVFNFPQKLYF